MAVPPTSPVSRRRKMEESESKKDIVPPPAKRSKNPGVRVQGGRIYDSENGKTCHQCRQKTMDFSASCKATKREKPCTIHFCHKCLLNRKQKGQPPTGILVHTAKLTGFSSVHELLSNGGENVMRDATVSLRESPASKKVPVPSKRSRDKENYNFEKNDTVCMQADCNREKSSLVEKNDVKATKNLKQMKLKIEGGRSDQDQNNKKLQINNSENGLPVQEDKKENLHCSAKNETMNKPPKPRGRPQKIATVPVRPAGKPLSMVAGLELPAEDVGPVLQFLEFCTVFSKVLDVKKGEPHAIIRELIRGSLSLRRCRSSSAIIQFQIRLLSFILEDMGEERYFITNGENSWLKALGKCLNEYKHLATGLPWDFMDNLSKYNELDSSSKLRILVFLCDEALGTEALRKFLDEENAKFVEARKEKTEQIIAAKTKEKLIKQTLKNDLARAMLPAEENAKLSISEHDKLISKIRHETEKAHQEMLESIELLSKKKHASDAIRTSPLFLEKNGTVYWRLNSYDGSSSIIAQDIEKWSVFPPQENWFIFDDEQKMVENYISYLRFHRAMEQKELKKGLQRRVGIEDELSDHSEPQSCLQK
ncbi:uncharacterized protein LOC110033444 isoform X3 [Phalaenopsis equestris]|uniref:uncharacterized protein LOC110033444 isoform X3 n=1 Tax=Phalaenopsis equestris TaxID=78828 RepID=UPI0009E61335|nr:uncharacterized protein LOC110033444 isoform X3 [Phalaenopsis equestris]